VRVAPLIRERREMLLRGNVKVVVANAASFRATAAASASAHFPNNWRRSGDPRADQGGGAPYSVHYAAVLRATTKKIMVAFC